jgi:hypothetical protein
VYQSAITNGGKFVPVGRHDDAARRHEHAASVQKAPRKGYELKRSSEHAFGNAADRTIDGRLEGNGSGSRLAKIDGSARSGLGKTLLTALDDQAGRLDPLERSRSEDVYLAYALEHR